MRLLNYITIGAIIGIPVLGQAQHFYNSDFSKGDKGVGTNYIFDSSHNALLNDGTESGAGYFTIGNNPQNSNPYWSNPLPLNAMIVNGSVTSGPTVWQERVSGPSLKVGQTYDFTIDIANLYPASPATLDLTINGVNAGTVTAGSGAENVFVLNSLGFTATDKHPLFKLTDTDTAFTGNDFAITHMGVQAVPEPANVAVLAFGVGAFVVRRRRKA